MNFLPRMSRVIVAATFMAGSPGSVFAAAAMAPTPANRGSSIPSANADKTGRGVQAQGHGLFGVPLYFEKNKGQTDASVKFSARAANYNLYLTATEAVIVLPAQKFALTQTPVVVRMKLKGANARSSVQGQNILPGRTSYMFGNDQSKWQIGVEQYAKVKLANVYPGIDVVYYGKKGNVEHDFIVAPGANPGRILMGFEGAKSLRLDARGNLILNVAGGDLTYKAPTLYQMVGGKRTPVQGRFMLAGDKHVRFAVGDYLKNKPLVIDPELVYSTFLGGSLEDKVNAITVDATRHAYLTGYSISDATGANGFPAPTAALGVLASNGKKHVFVAKLTADGAGLMWLAWLGGALDDEAKGIALDNPAAAAPNVFITGQTGSPTFTAAIPQQVCTTIAGGGTLAFVAELSQAGGNPAVVYSTCWGDTGVTQNVGNAIAVNVGGQAYVTGTTIGGNAPTFTITGPVPTVAPYGTNGGAAQAGFVLKLGAGGASVGYSMFLGAQDVITRSNAIAIDNAGRAVVAGVTTSAGWAVATGQFTGHFLSGYAGTTSAFVARVNAAGTAIDYGTYVNGNSDQEATAIKLNNGGAAGYHVFVAGWTLSGTGFPSAPYYNLPTAGAGSRPLVYQKDLPPGAADAPFVLRLNPDLVNPAPLLDNPQEMVYATHLGASGADRAYALALDDGDNAYIAGWTVSSDWPSPPALLDPVTAGANGTNVTGKTTSNTAGGQLGFVAAINSEGRFQPFFSYLGATNPGTAATGIVIDDLRNIYVAGFTPNADFPLVTGSLSDGSVPAKQINRTGIAGAFDGFVTKIAPVLSFGAPGAVPAPVPPACSITVSPGNGYAIGGTSVTISGTSLIVASTNAVTFGGVNAVSYEVDASSTVIIAMVPRHPLVGTLTLGQVALTVTNNQGSCSTPYSYVASPGMGASCGSDDFFFPSPATGAKGNFAYCMALPGTAKIRVYNAIGDLATKVEDPKGSGEQLSTINTGRLAPGVYLYIMEKDYGNGKVTRSSVKKFVVKH